MQFCRVRVFLLLALLSSAAYSQTVTATITGTVVDPTGAAAPGVAITAIQVATNLRYQAKTTDAGVYTLNFL
ncbi:MAG: carboxypeptidase-like regulatory domain-containing protein, partial [Bryobacteraceae bacterium]